jgi:hypothetical protein
MGGEAFVDRIRFAAALSVVGLLGVACLGGAGCTGRPSAAHEVTAGSPPPSPRPSADVPTGFAPPPTAAPTSASPSPFFGESFAVSCAGRPSADQVIALLRRTPSLLPRGVRASVKSGPLCAGTWQYTVVDIPDRDELQVVTRGAPTALVLVTAGTDVCNVTVRVSAPAGIRTVAHCT